MHRTHGSFLGTSRQFNHFSETVVVALNFGIAGLTKDCMFGPTANGAGAMSSVIILFALSLMIGFSLGCFSWRAIALSSLALAVLASVVLQRQGLALSRELRSSWPA